MNNEIKAYVETCDDLGALRVMRQAIDERLMDLTHAEGEQSGNVPPQAMLRRTEPIQAGSRAQPMTGPSPSPFYLDEVRARSNLAAVQAAKQNLARGGTEMQAKAMQMQEEGEEEDDTEEKLEEAHEKARQANDEAAQKQAEEAKKARQAERKATEKAAKAGK